MVLLHRDSQMAGSRAPEEGLALSILRLVLGAPPYRKGRPPMTHPERVEETRTVHDPFLGKDVQVSDGLVDRLRGKYAIGPTLPNGEPEFGWREFDTPPIQRVAADEIERLQKRASEAEREYGLLVAQAAKLERDRDAAIFDQCAFKAMATVAERRASEAERTFADLRNLIAVNLAANAELERRAEELESLYHQACEALEIAQSGRDEAVRRAEMAEQDRDAAISQRDDARTARLGTMLRANSALQSERDEAREALGKVVEALKAVRAWFSGNTVRSEKAMRPLVEQIEAALTHTGNDG